MDPHPRQIINTPVDVRDECLNINLRIVEDVPVRHVLGLGRYYIRSKTLSIHRFNVPRRRIYRQFDFEKRIDELIAAGGKT